MQVVRTHKTLVALIIASTICVAVSAVFVAPKISHAFCREIVIPYKGYKFLFTCGSPYDSRGLAATRRAVSQGMGIIFKNGCKLVGYGPRTVCQHWGGSIPACKRPPYVPGRPGGGGSGGGGRTPGTPPGPGGPGGVPRTPVDVCLNLAGAQETMPEGLRDVGGKVCQLDWSFQIFCRPNVNPVKTGEDFSFLASPFNHADGAIRYVWSETATGRSLGSSSSNDDDAITVSSDAQGVYQVTVTATDSSGATSQKVCGATISDTPSAGTAALNPEVTLEGGGLTNTTCPVEWTSSHTIECYLAKSTGTNKSVDLKGTDDVVPGTYRMRCISSGQVPQLVESDWVTCQRNPDIREQ